MVYIKEFSLFLEQAVALHEIDPVKTRIGVKTRQKEGFGILSITDDKKCYKYKASLVEVEQVLKVFLNEFMRRLSRRKDEKTFLAPGSGGQEGGKKKKKKQKK